MKNIALKRFEGVRRRESMWQYFATTVQGKLLNIKEYGIGKRNQRTEKNEQN